MKEFAAIYPKEEDLIKSTAAAQVNGYIAGYGTYDTLFSEVNSFGLSPEERKKLQNLVHASHH